MSEQGFSTGLVKVTDTFAPMIERQLTGNGVSMDGYAKQCVLNAISAINNAMDVKGIEWTDPQLDRNNVTQILLSVACLKLNAAASPREVYFQIRNVKSKDKDNKEVWKKQIEMGIEGDGNDSILARFGRDVEKVGQFWLVREQDQFEYPTYTGFDVTPPKWSPTGRGDVVRVVYPIMRKDGTVEYHISERDDVARNLVAHINNGLMNETFGICVDRYKATSEQRQQIAVKKGEILNKAKELGLGALDDLELQKWISPAWTEYQSRESMLVRKMRNNIVKRIPKDFGNAFVELVHAETTDPAYVEIRKEISENANREVIDVEFVDPVTPSPEWKKTPEASTTETETKTMQEEKQPAAVGPGF